jgi:putative ABC transport system ATP-binding protein
MKIATQESHVMLTMQNISKIYRTESVETHALREFSLSVNEGEFVSVSGPSGSGKTTFLNVAGLLEEFTSGIYELDGKDVTTMNSMART